MKSTTNYLIGLLFFNALSAIGGGLVLMTGGIKENSWLTHTSFSSLYVPGIILFAMVGGSSLLALIATKMRMIGWQITSTLAGLIMIFWIIGEVVSIRQFHYLQVIYLASGILVVLFSMYANNQGKVPK